MTKQVQALPTPSVSSVISMSVTTDSVVAVYVSEYEDKLYARQAELKATLVQVNKKLTELHATAVSAATFTMDSTIPGIGFKVMLEFDGPAVCDFKKGIVVQRVKAQLVSTTGSDRSSYCYTQLNDNIGAELMSDHAKWLSVKQDAMDELKLIQDDINNISRNERKARAAVAKQLMDQAGMTDLCGNTPFSLPKLG